MSLVKSTKDAAKLRKNFLAKRYQSLIRLLIVCTFFFIIPSDFANEASITSQMEAILSNATAWTEKPHSALNDYYSKRQFQPRWISTERDWQAAQSIILHLKNVKAEGLASENYHIAHINSLTEKWQQSQLADNGDLLKLDILITDGFMRYLTHLSDGILSQERFAKKWFPETAYLNFSYLLDELLTDENIKPILQYVMPFLEEYQALSDALKRYQSIQEAGGWPPISTEGPVLKIGVSDDRVTLLKIRLYLENYLEILTEDDSTVFDESLETAVKSFQKRYHLDADGEVGKKTLEIMNIPVEQRIQQIQANLERWRWLPNYPGKKFVIVNTAGFYLDYYEDYKKSLHMKVIVGKRYQKTPVFNDEIEYIVINPSWDVPYSIATKELLPKAKNNAAYLSNNRYRVFKNGVAVDPASIKWADYSGKNFPFRFQQKPGANNALGHIKFIFPNAHNIYLHDTPNKNLFDKEIRMFSHGCIRIEKPLQLAEALLDDETVWTIENIAAEIDSGKQQVIYLKEFIPIYILYWTTWVDSAHNIYFSSDSYGRDNPLIKALNNF